MVSQSRIIELISKINPSVYQIINADVFGTPPQPLGTSHGAVKNILSKHDAMLKVLMPTIILSNPNENDWYRKVRNYWDSFGIKVPIGGVKLEIGFNFDLNDHTRKDNIALLIKKALADKTEINTDDDFKLYVLSKVDEFEKYKYATPINPVDYLTWIFCLNHRRVANNATLIDKSVKIEFLLVDPKEVDNTRRANHSLTIEATKKYLEIITDRKKVRDILFIKGENASLFEDIDADAKLKTFADSNPKEFLAIVNDKSLTTKARIERYCAVGILKRLPNSSIVVDSNDTSVVLGHTLDEAVAYFSSEAVDKIAKVKEFAARYTAIKK
jgi:hypothetical protein